MCLPSIKSKDGVKIIIESSLVLIGFILVLTAALYDKAYGNSLIYYFPNIPSIPVHWFLIIPTVLYFISALVGVFSIEEKLKYNANLKLITASWFIATLILIFTMINFMFNF